MGSISYRVKSTQQNLFFCFTVRALSDIEVREKLKGESGKANPEKLATLGTQDTSRRETKQSLRCPVMIMCPSWETFLPTGCYISELVLQCSMGYRLTNYNSQCTFVSFFLNYV